ncbi:hypothetical protein F4780DRAFT_215778 [Xylariomycetidae sp. FL0641]|nr:hypothetical protein F4780DRAFT_215778 [Xylariomycetidae sp. FL0641]
MPWVIVSSPVFLCPESDALRSAPVLRTVSFATLPPASSWRGRSRGSVPVSAGLMYQSALRSAVASSRPSPCSSGAGSRSRTASTAEWASWTDRSRGVADCRSDDLGYFRDLVGFRTPRRLCSHGRHGEVLAVLCRVYCREPNHLKIEKEQGESLKCFEETRGTWRIPLVPTAQMPRGANGKTGFPCLWDVIHGPNGRHQPCRVSSSALLTVCHLHPLSEQQVQSFAASLWRHQRDILLWLSSFQPSISIIMVGEGP